MSDYKKLVRDTAKSFLEDNKQRFAEDKEEHGGAAEKPNLSLWIDRTRCLFEIVDGISKDWTRAEETMVTQSSRNAVTYGEPSKRAYYAFYEDILRDIKKLSKKMK